MVLVIFKRFRLKLLFLCIFVVVAGYSKEYYAVVKPYNEFSVKSNVDGRVITARDDLEGTIGKKKVIIKLDSDTEDAQLKNYKKQLKSVEKSIKISKKLIKNLKKVYRIKEKNYKNYRKSTYRSVVQKDEKYYDVATAFNNLSTNEENLETLERTKSDLTYKIFDLKKNIRDRTFKFKGYYIYKVDVKKYDYVTKGTILAKVSDVSKGKLIIFLDREDYKNINNKVIYVDGKKTTYKIDKKQKVADSVNISSYEIDIIVSKPKVFSNIVKVEFKYE